MNILAWVSVIGAVVAADLALLTANRRSTILAWLGVGGVVVVIVGVVARITSRR